MILFFFVATLLLSLLLHGTILFFIIKQENWLLFKKLNLAILLSYRNKLYSMF